jgi:hypothetical protein
MSDICNAWHFLCHCELCERSNLIVVADEIAFSFASLASSSAKSTERNPCNDIKRKSPKVKHFHRIFKNKKIAK